MTTLKETINAMVASSPDLDSGSLHRLEFWVGQLGTLLISDISAEKPHCAHARGANGLLADQQKQVHDCR